MEQFIYFVLGTLAAVIINLMTPRMLKWLEDRSLVNTQKRRRALEEERILIAELHANGSKMISIALRDLIIFFSVFSVEVLLIGTAIILQSFAYEMRRALPVIYLGQLIATMAEREEIRQKIESSVWVLLSISYLLTPSIITFALRSLGYMRKVLRFERYNQEVSARIKQLEENQPLQTRRGSTEIIWRPPSDRRISRRGRRNFYTRRLFGVVYINMLLISDARIARKVKSHLFEITPVKRLVVYSARGKPTKHTDLDLYIEPAKKVNPTLRRKIREIAWEVSLDSGVIISTLVASERLKGQPILKAIKAEGIAV